MTTTRTLILMLIAQTIAVSEAASPNVIGRWNVEITFANEEHRSLRFDAQDGGKGTLLLVDPKSKVWGSATPSEAKWTRSDDKSVTFSGAVEFLLGNVGRDAGTLVFKGKFEKTDSKPFALNRRLTGGNKENEGFLNPIAIFVFFAAFCKNSL